jgi:hypothetical protein
LATSQRYDLAEKNIESKISGAIGALDAKNYWWCFK